MQNLKTLIKPSIMNQLRNQSIRYYSNEMNNIAKMVVGRWNKFWYGGEQPYKSRDIIYENMMKEGKHAVALRYMQKILYARDKARQRYVKHNEHIRKLEDKIGEKGTIQPKSFSNRF